MKPAEVRYQEAQARQEAHGKLSVEQKLAKLDARFGAGKGAVRERAKLLGKLKAPVEASKSEKPTDLPVGPPSQNKEEKPGGKKHKNKKNKHQQKPD
jgi:hypothetical protein